MTGPLAPQDEQDLMRRLALGDEDAVRLVYERFGRAVYSLGLRMLRTPESAEDLTQEVFLTAWRRAGGYDPRRGRLSTWLMTIAHNAAVDRIRHDAARPRPALKAIDETVAPSLVEEDGVIDRLLAGHVLASLSHRERRLIELAYFRGWSAREIAEADGIPLGTVKTRLRATLIRLRAVHKGEAS
ncbi:MAG TPA: sigma-70 family RNA polymerase sigma factor [Actinomycetota bacterium]|nr:sigma-70 family RNA polymerase sigma factor [Actinomycetota bacterium]